MSDEVESPDAGRRHVVSAGGLLYRREDGKVQVVLAGRQRPGGEMFWGIPKGRVEKGESARETAVREVREETGLVGEIEAELGDIRYSYAAPGSSSKRQRYSKQVYYYLMRAVGGRFEDRDTEMDAVRWIPIEDAEETMTYENERGLLRRARALIGFCT